LATTLPNWTRIPDMLRACGTAAWSTSVKFS
jgi:hypothetical protein